MVKKGIITAIASLLCVFLIFAIVKHSRNILQQNRQDTISGGQTECTIGTVLDNTTAPETKPLVTESFPSQETTTPQKSENTVAPTTGTVATDPTNTSATVPDNTTAPETEPLVTESIPSQETTTPQKNENTVAPTTPPPSPTQPATHELPQWKQMYIIQATVWRTKYDHFTLVYIDGDDIPELYMYGNNQSELCAYRSDAVNPQQKVLISLRMNGMGGGNYHKKSGKFLNVCAEGDYLAMYVYELTNIFRQTFYGREDKSVNPPAYYIGTYTGAVSEDEFKNTVNLYIDTTKMEFLHQNALTLDAFVEYVTNF